MKALNEDCAAFGKLHSFSLILAKLGYGAL